MIKIAYNKQKSISLALALLAVLTFTYIILFEFILPANEILPKPSILIESVASLFNHYKFMYAYIFTLSIIYFVLFAGYFLIRIFRNVMFLFAENFANSIRPLVNAKYFIPILVIFLFYFWFGNNFYGELLFAQVIVIANLKLQYFNSVYKVKQEYLDVARSLNITTDKKKHIIWKSIQPDLFKSLELSYYSLWSLLLIYEYVNGIEGIGGILRLAIKYNDFSVVVLLLIIISISLFLGSILLNSIKRKFFFWSA